MHTNLQHLVREAGYETLFVTAAFVGLAVQPTMRNAMRLEQWVLDQRDRRQRVARLRAKGLLESCPGKADGALRLTALGKLVLAGGRDPEQAWNRSWDGQWRLLMFDIPKAKSRPRLKFWRWLRANHFGLLQQSVWLTPDPVPEVDKLIEQAGFGPSHVMVVTGELEGTLRPREVAESAWDFDEINSAYRRYAEWAERRLSDIDGAGARRLEHIVKEDRSASFEAVQPDPLLPKALLPAGYEGKRAWRLRQKIQKALWKHLPSCSPASQGDGITGRENRRG